tara:strand:- start:665 stop:961 length:297 start_codon:yes stop_codon:yes gene_type:complete
MGRIMRIALAENIPQAIDLGMTTAGKLLIKNAGSNDVYIGYDQNNVLAASASNYITIDAGVTWVFDAGPGVGFLNQTSNMWFSAQGGDSTVEIWVASV